MPDRVGENRKERPFSRSVFLVLQWTLLFSKEPYREREREGEKKMRIGGLAIYPERIVAELEIWISNDALRGLTAP